jgi:hypothetical protein
MEKFIEYLEKRIELCTEMNMPLERWAFSNCLQEARSIQLIQLSAVVGQSEQEQLRLGVVSQQRELLLDFLNVLDINNLLEPNIERITVDDIDEYLKI